MKFGPVPIADAAGKTLAHSLRLDGGVLKKGHRLDGADIARLAQAGLTDVVVAELEQGDLDEDEAALAVARCLAGEGLRLGAAATGRVNVIAERAGLVALDVSAISALNAIDEGMTLATLSDAMRVDAEQLVATVKIIPYGLAQSVVETGVAALGRDAIRLRPFQGGSARLVMTEMPGGKDSLLVKSERVVRARLDALGYRLDDVTVVAHREESLAEVLPSEADLTLVLGAAATADRRDVGPAALEAAGGTIERFGMPVDPGNLLFLGQLNGKSVVGLPGCARSPALNGADWVLERLSARMPVTGEAIAAMGVGGLLKEMPERPHPRRSREKG